MKTVFSFCTCLFFCITSAAALFGGSVVAANIVLWSDFVIGVLMLLCYLIVGVAKMAEG